MHLYLWCKMFVKHSFKNEFLFPCPHSTLAITGQVCELVKTWKWKLAAWNYLCSGHWWAAGNWNAGWGKLGRCVYSHPHMHTLVVHTTNECCSVYQTTVPKVTPLSLNCSRLIIQLITLFLCQISNWGLCHSPREFAISWILAGCHSHPL